MKRKDVFMDYYSHPTWASKSDKRKGRKRQNKQKKIIREHDSWIIFGHFSPSLYYDFPYDWQIIILRDPFERAISHFHYVKQSLPDNNITRRRHTEVGLIKDNLMNIEQFVELDHIKYFYSKFYLKNIALDNRLIAGSLHDFESTLRKVAEATGITLDHTVYVNKSSYRGSFDYLRPNFETDLKLYDALINLP